MDPLDKSLEQSRYNDAYAALLRNAKGSAGERGSVGMCAYLKSPYVFYEAQISKIVGPNSRVLELGAGSGPHTLVLLQTGATIVATDIADVSLKLLSARFGNVFKNFSVEYADIESLPFADSTFEIVTCAGSLSYGNPSIVFSEIQRVLSPGGTFICVDSLNNNPIYRFNRWVHYLRGNRTYSTLCNMPNLDGLHGFSCKFSRVEIEYFGSLSFLMPILARLIGDDRSAKFSDWFDRIFNVRRSAFKFVMVASSLVK